MTDTIQAFDLGSISKTLQDAPLYLKMLIYGDPKVGKTTFAGTAPSPYFLAVEPGVAVLRKNEENKRRFADTKVVDVPNMTWFNRIVSALREGQLPDRKTVVLDTLTEFQDRVLMQWTKHAMSSGLTDNPNEFAPTWPEFNSTTNILKKAVRELRDLQRHVIVIAHCRDDKDKTRGGMQVDRPALMPSLGNSTAAMFNLVGYMEVNSNGVHTMRVVPTPNIVAGNHVWDGPPVIENPTFNMFLPERATPNVNGR